MGDISKTTKVLRFCSFKDGWLPQDALGALTLEQAGLPHASAGSGKLCACDPMGRKAAFAA